MEGGGVGGSGAGGNRALSDKIVREDTAGNNYVVCFREANQQTMYRRREDVWIQ